MNKRLAILAALLSTVGLLLFSIFVLKPAKPIIDIKGEKLITIADLGNDAISISITNTLFTAWVAMALLLAFCFFAIRKRSLIPSGIYNLFEAIIEGILSLRHQHRRREERPALLPGHRHLLPLHHLRQLALAHADVQHDRRVRAAGRREAGVPRQAPWSSRTGGLADPAGRQGRRDRRQGVRYPDRRRGGACREKAIEEATAGKVEDGEKVGVIAPFFRGINTDLMTPLSFALVSAFFVEWWGISTLGFFKLHEQVRQLQGARSTSSSASWSSSPRSRA